MPTNNQQLNTADDFLDFNFDENDVLVKDGDDEVVSSKQENIETRKQENKIVRSKPVKQFVAQANTSPIRRQMGVPLELKKMKEMSDTAENVQKDFIKQANMQKEKVEALSREGESLVYDEKDEEEIEKFKKRPLAKSNASIDLLARTLMNQLNIVSTLKIDLIKRLKNIIDSFLRDIRTARATEEILRRSLDSGGLNLSPEHSKQIVDLIKDEHKKIHSAVFIVAKNNVEAPKEDDLAESLQPIESIKEEVEVISKKTAREAQVGIFSDEIANSMELRNINNQIRSNRRNLMLAPATIRAVARIYPQNISLVIQNNFQKRDNPKAQFGASGKKDLTQRENGLVVSSNLRAPEISAPKSIKRLTGGTVAAEAPNVESPKAEEQKESTNHDILSQDFQREEILKSLNEELAQDEIKIEKLEKQKASWFFRLFGLKSTKSKVHKVQSPKSTELKVGSRKSEVGSLQFKKEIQHQQPVVRHVVHDKPNFDNRPRMEDVKMVHPRLAGPIEELSEMTLVDFRRLGSTAQDSVDKIKEKIEISAKEFFNQKAAAINGWRKSQPNQLYIELGRKSLFQKMPVEDLISQYNLENKPTLTKEEFDLISRLNKELRY